MLTGDARALLQAEAFAAGRAVAATGRRHVRLDARAVVFVPLSLAGEDGALLAFGISRAPGDLALFVCPEPRAPATAALLLSDLARWIVGWLDPLAADRVTIEPLRPPIARESPQIVVPTQASATLLRRLGERLSWRSDRRDPGLARAGGWLHFFCDRHELVAGDSALVVMTEALQQHFVPPISPAECSHLLVLIAALDPPAGVSAVEAAACAEDEAGSSLTTPAFDRAHLSPAIEAFNEARRGGRPTVALAGAISALLRPIVQRLAEACHRGLALLRAIPPISALEGRRALAERRAFTRHADYLDRGGFFARQDSLRRGLYLVDEAEAELGQVTWEALAEDPVLRAVASLSGEALDGEILSAQLVDVQGPKRRVKRLQIALRTEGPWRPSTEQLALLWRGDVYRFEIGAVIPEEGSTRVVLQSCDQIQRANSELLPALHAGDRLGLAIAPDTFPGLPVPAEAPWMLAREGTDG